MAKFLNTRKLKIWIQELIRNSERELVIVVPYIRISEEMYDVIQDADKRGVETTIIYREDKLNPNEKEKIESLNNINLLHHPNVHCKCYFNGELIIICSMNLYEYSERNNREMGVLVSRKPLEDKRRFYSHHDHDELFYDAIHEIREILNGSKLELYRTRKQKEKFLVNILETEEEKARTVSAEISKVCLNKVFSPVKVNRDLWLPKCKNYFDNIDVTLENNRIAIEINRPNEDKNYIHQKWMRSYDEYEFKGFKFYWNKFDSLLYLYKNSEFDWTGIEDQSVVYKKYKQGIDMVISKYRSLSSS